MTFPNIATVIENVVKACRDSGSDVPYFEYGHDVEIVNTLMEKDRNDIWKLKKYPAIFLFMPVTESRNEFESECEVNLVFVTDTKPEWKAKDRDQYVFEPVLIPLYNSFMANLKKSSELYISQADTHEFTKHYYWGSSQTGANVANDYADAIEVKGLKIKLYPTC